MDQDKCIGRHAEEVAQDSAELSARLDTLESQDWRGLNAHLHRMWHDLERRFDELEARVGLFSSKIELPRTSFSLAQDERAYLERRVAELERQQATNAGRITLLDDEIDGVAGAFTRSKTTIIARLDKLELAASDRREDVNDLAASRKKHAEFLGQLARRVAELEGKPEGACTCGAGDADPLEHKAACPRGIPF